MRIERLMLLIILFVLTLPGATTAAQRLDRQATDVTRIRVTDKVVVSDVKRLGIDLGTQSYYDAGQMMKNLLFRNPGFEGMIYRTIMRCNGGGQAGCVDRRQGVRFPADFWDGATFEVLDGAATGRRGMVISSSPVSRGPGSEGFDLHLDGAGKPIGAGDWMAVAKEFPEDPAAGWWPSLNAGALLKAERADLPQHTQGRQALRIEASGPGQSAQIKSYFDSTEGFTFVRLKGPFRLSFKAESVPGNGIRSRVLHLHVARIVPGMMSFLEKDLPVGSSWTDYHQEFSAKAGSRP